MTDALTAEHSGPDEQMVSTTHHTFLVGPWADEGVHVVQADDPDAPVLLLRDRREVIRLVTALLEAVATR